MTTAELTADSSTSRLKAAIPEPREGGTIAQPQRVVASLLGGEERAGELGARLARESGSSLIDLYEALRRGLYLTPRGATPLPRLGALELDERLARLAGRLTEAPSRSAEPVALILTTARRGVSACLHHILAEQGIPARTLDLAVVARHHQISNPVLSQFPALRHVIVDCADAGPQELLRLGALVQQLRVVSARTSVVLLADETSRPDARLQLPVGVALASSLPELMTTSGIVFENPLTVRELAVLEFVASGATNRQTASAMGISIATVKTYLERAQGKLKSQDRASAVSTALRRGWL